MSSRLSPQTVRKRWIAFLIVLAVLLLGDFAYLAFDAHSVHVPHGDGIDATFGFSAWFGLVASVGLVLVSVGLGFVLKRREGYYRE